MATKKQNNRLKKEMNQDQIPGKSMSIKTGKTSDKGIQLNNDLPEALSHHPRQPFENKGKNPKRFDKKKLKK